jgi:hypothetical protein
MKTAFRLLLVAVVVGGWTLAAAAVHVIYSGRITLIPKEKLSFSDTYVDLRAWTLADVPSHPELVKRIIESGKSELLTHLGDAKSTKALDEQLKEAMEKLPENSSPDAEKREMAPTTKPVTTKL